MSHIPVLLEQAIEFLNCQKQGIYVDGTLGGGGHTCYLAQSTNEKTRIIAIDRDKESIKIAQQKLKKFKNITFVKDRFENLDKILANLKIKKIDGVLLDLGFSTSQLEDINRGFSFQENKDNLKALLDMRMDQDQSFSAFHLLNSYTQKKLKQIFYQWGEIKQANFLAYLIVGYRQNKPFETVGDLLEAVNPLLINENIDKKRKFLANLFRAIRIEVNQEIEFLEQTLFMIITLLKPLARLVVISFHSLEDRIVKHSFKKMEKQKKIKVLSKKPITPCSEEILLNPRAKSAKLRAVEKI